MARLRSFVLLTPQAAIKSFFLALSAVVMAVENLPKAVIMEPSLLAIAFCMQTKPGSTKVLINIY